MTRASSVAFTCLQAALVISACGTPTMLQMREVFQADVRDQVGKPYNQMTGNEFEFIGIRRPTDIRNLQNGNILYVYGGYWVQYHLQRIPCTVFLEVDPETGLVTSAYSKGKGCYHRI